jgi:hypothetical protein
MKIPRIFRQFAKAHAFDPDALAKRVLRNFTYDPRTQIIASTPKWWKKKMKPRWKKAAKKEGARIGATQRN